MKFWSKKNTLDEMQEQQLLHLEAQGFRLLWGRAAAGHAAAIRPGL